MKIKIFIGVSSSQKRIYLTYLLDKLSLSYNMPCTIELKGEISKHKLENAFNKLIERHEILRTTFHILDDGTVVQKIHPPFKINVETIESKDNFIKPFDLSTLSLLRVGVNKNLLLFDMHHIISDGYSIGILTKELSKLYDDILLDPIKYQYKDYSEWENQEDFSMEEKYWLNKFDENIPLLNMPLDFDRESFVNLSGDIICKNIDTNLSEKIEEFALKLNTTPYILLLSAYFLLLSRYSKQNDIIVGTPTIGRTKLEFMNTLGTFINVLPIRVQIGNNFSDFINTVKSICLEALTNQKYPFDLLVQKLNLNRNLNRNPLFDTIFTYQNEGLPDININGTKSNLNIIHNSFSKFDFSFEIIPKDAKYILNIEYRTSLFKKDTIEKMYEDYINILNEILIDSDKVILPTINTPVIYKTQNVNKEYVKPTSELEIKLVSIWEQLLGYSPIGINDNFFEMGGDSMLAIKCQIETLKNNISLNYGDIFKYPTIAQLCTIINNTINYTTNDDTAKYEHLNKFLKNDSISYTKKDNIGNVLLTGANGFLGAHILDSYIRNETGNIYCIIRRHHNQEPLERLIEKLKYYFDDSLINLINKRIFVVEADLSKEIFGLSNEDYYNLSKNVDLVINCAAKVIHYGDYDDLKKINVTGTKNIIDFCHAYNKKLLHISTTSVSGNTLVDDAKTRNIFTKHLKFTEKDFYVGQPLENVYVRTKFEAEALVLNAISKGLDAYIMRMGNLTNRYKDGKFQPNKQDNAFYNRLISFMKIGAIPDNLKLANIEFTPVDFSAEAIITLAKYSMDNKVFHLYNNNYINANNLINIINKLDDYNFSILSKDDFENLIITLLHDNDKKDILIGIIRDLDNKKQLLYNSTIELDSHITTKILTSLGFVWPKITAQYIYNIIKEMF